MDTGTYSDDEYTPPSSPEDPIYTSFGGGMFAGSQHFTIGGGTFNNNNNTTNHYHPAPVGPPDFRMISMGDIDLQQELMVPGHSGLVGHRPARNCVRRVYSAKMGRLNTELTVAIYERDGAEKDWRRDVEIYMSLRHLNIVQMYGTARSGAMYATIFHGDLIPFQQFVASASPIITVYIYACYVTEWREAYDYVKQSPYFGNSNEMHSTLLIRRSNGRLCADFGPRPDGKNQGYEFFPLFYSRESHPPGNPSLDPTIQEAAAIHSLTLEEYHEICWFTLRQFRFVSVSSSATISSGAVFRCPPDGQPLEGAEIAYLPGAQFYRGDWHLGEETLSGMLMKNKWTRFDAKDVCNCVLAYTLDLPVHYWNIWHTQANYIFSRLRITSNLEDYLILYRVKFEITIGTMREDAPPGYLFLCPATDFHTGLSAFRWPDCPAYWSLDPSGLDRLSTEEAAQLGFPSFQLTTEIHGWSWDTSVYTGLRQFHRAKGFDPDSQDIALHLGEPLFLLSGDTNPPFAHVEEGWSDDGTDEGETDDEWEDAQSLVEVEDGDKSTEDSDANEDEGLLNVCTEPPEQNTAEACQEPARSVDQDPNPAELRVPSAGVTGSGFIHHITGGLQRGLARGLGIETENVDAEPISPILI